MFKYGTVFFILLISLFLAAETDHYIIRILNDGRILVDFSRDDNITEGDILNVINIEEDIIHPVTNETIPGETYVIGKIEIIQIKNSYVIALPEKIALLEKLKLGMNVVKANLVDKKSTVQNNPDENEKNNEPDPINNPKLISINTDSSMLVLPEKTDILKTGFYLAYRFKSSRIFAPEIESGIYGYFENIIPYENRSNPVNSFNFLVYFSFNPTFLFWGPERGGVRMKFGICMAPLNSSYYGIGGITHFELGNINHTGLAVSVFGAYDMGFFTDVKLAIKLLKFLGLHSVISWTFLHKPVRANFLQYAIGPRLYLPFCIIEASGGLNNSFDLVSRQNVPELGFNINLTVKFLI